MYVCLSTEFVQTKFNSMLGIPDDALLKNWLDEIGPEEAYDDLAKLEDKLMKGSSMEECINRGIDSLKQ